MLEKLLKNLVKTNKDLHWEKDEKMMLGFKFLSKFLIYNIIIFNPYLNILFEKMGNVCNSEFDASHCSEIKAKRKISRVSTLKSTGDERSSTINL